MMLILFVCRGNTCRSPLAEALAVSWARRQCTDLSIAFGSAGVAPSPVGGSASSGARTVAALNGLDLTAHRSRAADARWLSSATHILALDRSVRDALLAGTAPALHARVALLLSHAPQLGYDDVADPWGGGAADYARAFAEIETAVTALLATLTRTPSTGSA
jgi:protein-tyrosine phosphatase